MVKNHARKTAARLHQQATGENYTSSLRSCQNESTPTIEPVPSSYWIASSPDTLNVDVAEGTLRFSWYPTPFTSTYDPQVLQHPKALEALKRALNRRSLDRMLRQWSSDDGLDDFPGEALVTAALASLDPPVSRPFDETRINLACDGVFCVNLPAPSTHRLHLKEATALVRHNFAKDLSGISDFLGYDPLEEALRRDRQESPMRAETVLADSAVMHFDVQDDVLVGRWSPVPFTENFTESVLGHPLLERIADRLAREYGTRTIDLLVEQWSDGRLHHKVPQTVMGLLFEDLGDVSPVRINPAQGRFEVEFAVEGRHPGNLAQAIEKVRRECEASLTRIDTWLGVDVLDTTLALHTQQSTHRAGINRAAAAALRSCVQHGAVCYFPDTGARELVPPERMRRAELLKAADRIAAGQENVRVAGWHMNGDPRGPERDFVAYPQVLSDGTRAENWQQAADIDQALWFGHQDNNADVLIAMFRYRLENSMQPGKGEVSLKGGADVAQYVDIVEAGRGWQAMERWRHARNLRWGPPHFEVGQQFCLAGDRKPWTVQALSDHCYFVIATRDRGREYVILDQARGIVGHDNNGGLSYTTRRACQQVALALKDPERGRVRKVNGTEVSGLDLSDTDWRWAQFADTQPDERTTAFLPELRMMLTCAPNRPAGPPRPGGDFCREGGTTNPLETVA